MTHSGGKQHEVGDRGQRFEVSYCDEELARKPFGWTDDIEAARRMADAIEKHPTWGYPWITDRHVEVPNAGELSGPLAAPLE